MHDQDWDEDCSFGLGWLGKRQKNLETETQTTNVLTTIEITAAVLVIGPSQDQDHVL